MDVIHHLAIPTGDVAASVRWYREHTDCTVDYQDATWALLGFSNIKLALVTPGQHPPHLAIVREDAGRFGPLTRHRDGTRSVYIEDSAGNTIEVMEAASLTPPAGQTPSGQ
ncbi:MAG: VOC family protein [Pseudomonadota bacterium]|nr:VOC family protein [Pseudomonadota bacterium]